jgi:ABC-2 type transport system permease protein
MKAIFKKEITMFFANTTGFLVLGIYWIINVLFLWFFNSDYNILNTGNANLVPFFELSAWIFIFLIPAICMKSFSEEQKSGTLELLYTKPITKLNLVLGKFWAALVITGIGLLPSLLFLLCLHFLVQDAARIDFPAMFGSYLGLSLLTCCYIAISLLASAWSKNQIVSFSIGCVLCLAAYFALEGISNIALFGSSVYGLEYLSLSFHYKSLSRGVIDSRNIFYFLSFTALFISICIYRLQKTQEQ